MTFIGIYLLIGAFIATGVFGLVLLTQHIIEKTNRTDLIPRMLLVQQSIEQVGVITAFFIFALLWPLTLYLLAYGAIRR